MPAIVRARVESLLDEYDHAIEFPLSSEFVILYGPNGVGKTRFLELIRSTVALSTQAVARQPFSRLALTYDDDSEVEVTRVPQATDDGAAVTVSYRLFRPNLLEDVHWEIQYDELGDSREWSRFIRTRTSWRQIGPDLWEDSTDGEVVNSDELESRYPSFRREAGSSDAAPEDLAKFLTEAPVHLIETQRLTVKAQSSSRVSLGRRHNPTRPVISDYAEDLGRRLQRALAENSRRSQQLDRSYPRRILAESSDRSADEDEIREKYSQQNRLRQELASIGLIRDEPDLPLPDRDLAPWERNVLWTYLADTDEKLATFDEILAKVTLFRKIANRRFLQKHVEVTAEGGLKIVRSLDERIIDPASLSSGEQHELILIYDLLFNVRKGATVLIDEPEISLHVAWQQQFIPDIVSIAQLASLRFIIATHSPQIIGKAWENTVQLGPIADL